MSSLFGSLDTTKLDKADVVDPSTAKDDGKAADAKSTYEELTRISGMASDAKELAESKADQSELEAHVASTNNPHSVTAEQVNAYTKETVDAKLDEKADIVGGKIPASQLPSYVDDVLEYDTMSAFPVTGEGGKIYVAKDTNLTYRWSGTQYVEISPSPLLDDTVTEKSPNGVKSSGIWSWVKSLLPKWLTSNYAEPATVASVKLKADKATTLAGYGITDAVPFVDDVNGAKTAVTIGSRKDGSSVGIHSIADGLTVTASGEHSHAEGGSTTASVYCSHSEGFDTTASGEGSHAEGDSTSATEKCSHTEGLFTGTYGIGSHAEGEYATTSGECAHAEGYNANASGKCSHAEGYNTNASGKYSHAEGENTTVSGDYSHAEGSYTAASGNRSHAEGNGTTAHGECSHAEGANTTASGAFSHAEGVMSQTLSEHSFAFVWNGDTERAATYDSHGAGTFNINPVGGLNGFYIGEQTLNAILDAILENKADKATTLAGYGITDAVPFVKDMYDDKTAVTIGVRIDGERVGDYSFANGGNVTASGSCSHAEGISTIASADNSHSEGYDTTASGPNSHAEGDSTTASGSSSHAEGVSTTASGSGSHAEGYMSQTLSEHSYAFVWNGDTEMAATYDSHGAGTFNINPKGWLDGFYIGDYTLSQVLYEAVAGKANLAALAPEYSSTSAYSVGAIVYYRGNIYQCKTAIAAGVEEWNAEHWELRKLDDFFTNSNSLLTATIENKVNTMFDDGETTNYPRTTTEG